jgi:hypothetical protein
VCVDVRDERVVGGDDSPHVVYDCSQPVLNRALNLPEGIGEWW